MLNIYIMSNIVGGATKVGDRKGTLPLNDPILREVQKGVGERKGTQPL